MNESRLLPLPLLRLIAVLFLVTHGRVLHAEPAAQIDVAGLPAAVVEDIVVPVPSEVFSVLDKLGQPDWKAQLSTSTTSLTPSSRPQIALLLGTVIADGFIAVQAQDSERVKDAGREVLRLAGAIGVRDSVVRRSKSIIEAAEEKAWNTVRSELDKALTEVRGAMTELNDDQLAQLVSLGGWLRGTQAVTSIVKNSFSKDTAELLHQPMLVDYFVARLDELPPAFNETAIIGKIGESLLEIRPLIEAGNNAPISLASVERIHTIATALVSEITSPTN
ncbi:MAG: hypothetical protein SNJ52_00865 [Verrucomicrobiia bacterium]